MSKHVKQTVANVIPGMRYEDAPAAIEWLCKAFGFEQMLVVPAGEGKIAHAQLRFGSGMVMLGSTGGSGEYDQAVKAPKELGGGSTGGVYVVVEDVDAHYQNALAHGAEVVLPNVDQEYGGRGYTCRDPEGHVWSFGTYDPWTGSDS